MRFSQLQFLLLHAVAAQWLPDVQIEHTSKTYAGEQCLWYDVNRLRWRRGATMAEESLRHFPRLGALTLAPPANRSVCDGYGARKVRVSCSQCPGDPFNSRTWSVLQCSATPLVPPVVPAGPTLIGTAGIVNVLLVVSDHNNHGLFAQVERVLNQLHLAGTRGMTPFVFLGRKVFASPDSCSVGENQYFEPAAGDNVWEYYFEQVSDFRLGLRALHGRRPRVLVADVDDARRHAIQRDRDAVVSYFRFDVYDDNLHQIRVRVRAMGARLLADWVRVRPPLRAEAAALIAEWRARAPRLLGVHLRGTDKVTHPKIPLERYYRYVDAYLLANPSALIVLCTDDASYYHAFVTRYKSRVVSRGVGYKTRNVVRDPAISRAVKGKEAVVDALLLAHCDFLLKGTSSLAEFAIWYNPQLSEEHIDLQFETKATASDAFKRLVPDWAGGPRASRPFSQVRAEAMLDALRGVGRTRPHASGATVGVTGERVARLRDAHASRWDGVEPQSDGAGVSLWPEQTLYRPESAGAGAGGGGMGGRGKQASLKEVKLERGACVGKLRNLTRRECKQYAMQEGLKYLGHTEEAKEYAGCLLWNREHVEFNLANPGSSDCSFSPDAVCVCLAHRTA